MSKSNTARKLSSAAPSTVRTPSTARSGNGPKSGPRQKARPIPFRPTVVTPFPVVSVAPHEGPIVEPFVQPSPQEAERFALKHGGGDGDGIGRGSLGDALITGLSRGENGLPGQPGIAHGALLTLGEIMELLTDVVRDDFPGEVFFGLHAIAQMAIDFDHRVARAHAGIGKQRPDPRKAAAACLLLPGVLAAESIAERLAVIAAYLGVDLNAKAAESAAYEARSVAKGHRPEYIDVIGEAAWALATALAEREGFATGEGAGRNDWRYLFSITLTGRRLPMPVGVEEDGAA